MFSVSFCLFAHRCGSLIKAFSCLFCAPSFTSLVLECVRTPNVYVNENTTPAAPDNITPVNSVLPYDKVYVRRNKKKQVDTGKACDQGREERCVTNFA